MYYFIGGGGAMQFTGFRTLGVMWDRYNRNELNRMLQELYGKNNSFQTQLDNLVISSGDSNAEVVQARGDNSLLYQRLDKTDGMTSLLQLGVTQQNERNDNQDDEINNLKSVKADKDELNQFLGSVSINDLTYPLVVAHRGAKAIYPENSIEAMQHANDDGYPIELDVMLNGDGVPVLLHDTTLNRTTNQGGNIKNYTTAGFLNAKINELGTSFVGSTTTLENVFRVMGNRAIYILESKEVVATDKILRLIEKYGLKHNVVMQSFDYADAKKMAGQGYEVCYLRSAGATNPIDVKNSGINVIGMSKNNATKSVITTHKNAGLAVWIYTVNERKEADALFNNGADALFSDDPRWIDRTAKVLNRDNFDQQTWYHGQKCLPAGAYGSQNQGNRGEFYYPGRFGWKESIAESGTGSSAKRDFTMQGWAGDLAENFVLEGTIFFEDVTNGYASIVINTPKEYFDDHSAGSSGYNIVFWSNGTMRLYEVTEGSFVSGGDKTDLASLESGQRVDFKITVSGDTIKLEREDALFTGVAFTDTNTKYRKGFLHLGRSNIGATFGNMKYTIL